MVWQTWVEGTAFVSLKLGAEPWIRRGRLVLPWLSLATGAWSAVFMDRGPAQSKWVAVSAGAVWCTLIGLHFVLRLRASLALPPSTSTPPPPAVVSAETGTEPPAEGALSPAPPDQPTRLRSSAPPGKLRARLLMALHQSSLLLTQSMIQFCLFFSWPFYFHAAHFGLDVIELGHALFLGAMSVASLAALWDPWTEYLLEHSLLSPLLPLGASFLALNAVLPSLGGSTASSLWFASAAAVLGALVLSLAQGTRGRRLAQGTGVVLLPPLLLLLGGARLVPPAPLRLVRAEMGLGLAEKWIDAPVTEITGAPERLICATAIASPVGVHDRLFHVWLKDGKEVSRLEVDIVGGREQGYRTRSWLRQFGASPAGRYVCRVETGAGQRLGSCRVRIL
jgi:hypothetical protein